VKAIPKGVVTSANSVKKLLTRLPAVLAATVAAGQMATAAKSAHADGIYINATSNALGKTKSFLHAMQIAGY